MLSERNWHKVLQTIWFPIDEFQEQAKIIIVDRNQGTELEIFWNDGNALYLLLGGGYTLDPCILMYVNDASIKNE